MNVKEDFPIFSERENIVYLDNAATTQKPRQVIDAISDFYEKSNANVGRGVHFLAEEATNEYESARGTVASFVGAKPEEFAFTFSTTDGLNKAILSWGLQNLKEGDEVITTIMEHHSHILPWMKAAELTGAKLVVIDIDDDFELDYAELEDKICKKTKAVACTRVSNALGTVNDVRRVSKMAHDNGAMMFIDGAQSVPHEKTDVRRMGADVLAFSGHKMLGPFGIGGLYIQEGLEINPLELGGGTSSNVTKEGYTLLSPPHRFEAGTPNVAGAIGLTAAVEYLEGIGMENIQKHEDELIRKCLNMLQGLDLSIYRPRSGAGILSFNVRGLDSHEVSQVLSEKGIATRSGVHCCGPLMKRLGIEGTARASFYVYNTTGDIEYFVSVLEELAKL
jgi:cysteine desulfurase / selenocysteine lyase